MHSAKNMHTTLTMKFMHGRKWGWWMLYQFYSIVCTQYSIRTQYSIVTSSTSYQLYSIACTQHTLQPNKDVTRTQHTASHV